jgi:16S rRNA (guanine966-N2)-methyltransferase
MRIISGERRGQNIEGPPTREVRATSDMVREAIFNILRDEIAGRPIIDLFAGTGSLGLEALSRGAVHAIFIEKDRATAALIRRNLATLRFEDRGRVVPTDAFRWVQGFRPVDPNPHTVFVDPPYREFDNHPERMRRLVATLLERLPEESVIMVESGRVLSDRALPEPPLWEPRKYGSRHLVIRRVETTPPEAPEAAATGVAEAEPPPAEPEPDTP